MTKSKLLLRITKRTSQTTFSLLQISRQSLQKTVYARMLVQLHVHRAFNKAFRRAPKTIQARSTAFLQSLAESASTEDIRRMTSVTALSGTSGWYRIRFGQ